MNGFRSLRALTWAYLIQTWRNKAALFWNLVLPLLFLVGLSYIFGGGESSRVTGIVPGILTINLLTGAFFGVSLHMVTLREREFYRRLHATPVSALPVVVAHALTALINMLVSTALQIAVARALFRIHIQSSLAELGLAIGLAAFALIPLGLLVGSVAQDMRTAPVLSNLVFFPLMFLSGAAMPLHLMPPWIQGLSEWLPSTYVVQILQAAILRGNLAEGQGMTIAILMATGLIGLVFNTSLFRWDSAQPINRRASALVVLSLAALYGVAFARGSRTGGGPDGREAHGTAVLPEVPAGKRVLLGMTILDGSGGRLQPGRLVLEGERIIEVGTQTAGIVETNAVTDLSGLFLIPGLIDSHVHIGGSAGGSVSSAEFMPARVIHDLQVYLAMGVTSVVSMTDDLDDLQRLREMVAARTMRAPRIFFSGPGITTPRGHPAAYFLLVPGLAENITRQVESPDAAIEAVRALAAGRVNLIKFFLDQGRLEESLPVLSESELRAGIQTARQLGLRTTVHVDTDEHARLALRAGASSLEHVPPDLGEETIAALIRQHATLTPTLAASEGLATVMAGTAMTQSRVVQWVDPGVLDSLRSPDSWIARVRESPDAAAYYARRHRLCVEATRRAAAAGVTVLAGSDAGNPASFHGIGLIRELELLVQEAGMNPAAALQAAAGLAAQRLGATDVGRIAPGAYADFVVLGDDPTRNIEAIQDVRSVYFGGTPLSREDLVSTSPGGWMPRSGVEAQ